MLSGESTPGGVVTISRLLETTLLENGIECHRPGLRQCVNLLSHVFAPRLTAIISANIFSATYLGLFLSFLSGKPLISWVHGPITEVLAMSGTSRLKMAIMRLLYRHIDHLVFVSSTAEKSYLAFSKGLSKGQTSHVICNAVSISPQLLRTKSRTVPIRLVYAGRLSIEKDPLLLVAALRMLPDSFNLTMVGDGPLMAQIQSAGYDLVKAGRLQLVGYQPWAVERYRDFDMSILASHFEGCPLAALESISAGIPCVGIAIPALVEIFGSDAPFLLAKERSAESLAEIIQTVAAMSPDAMQQDLARIALRYQVSNFSKRWLQLVRSC